MQQSGAAEACWAHNPEVDGSKPSSAKAPFLVFSFNKETEYLWQNKTFNAIESVSFPHTQ